MTNTAKQESAETFLAAEMQRLSARKDITKRTAVRLAVGAAINSGVFPKGGLIPSEKRLTEVLGVSLGTVQAALRQLQQYDVIVRRRGDGTLVTSTEALSRDVWHFRLLAKDTKVPLRLSRVDVAIEKTDSAGPWSQVFPDDASFIRIRRRLVMNKTTNVGAEMILPHRLVLGLEDTAPAELKMLNIRPYLAEKHGVEVSGTDQQIETVQINDLDAAKYGLESKTLFFQITATALSPNGQPAYYQRILAPCDQCCVTF